MTPPVLPPPAPRDRQARELMDDPDCDLAALERTYAHFRVVNALVAGWRLTYRQHLRPVLRADRTSTVLDVGSGGGDRARALLRWARRDGLRLEVTGVDPDPRAHAWASRQPPTSGLTLRQASSRDLVREGCSFDVVVSNHLLHHLDDDELAALLADSERLARVRVVHSDLTRSRLAAGLFSVATRPFFRGSFIRPDGLTSLRRSYTADELRAVVPTGWRVQRQRPWRLLLLRDPGSGPVS